MTSIKLTAKQTALMTQIAKQNFSFFDDGLVAGSGIWMDALTHETGPDVAANPRGAATVTTTLAKKGLLVVQGGAAEGTDDSDGAWVALTEAGAAWCAEYNEAQATAPELPLEEETPAPAPAKKTRKLPVTAANKMPKKARAKKAVEAPETTPEVAAEPTAPETAPEPETAAPVAEDLGYTVEEWDEETEEWGTQYWIHTVFPDGSMTLRRRRKVSGAWRTDFWGQVAGAEKRVFTTSGAAKAARAEGKFTV